MHVVDEAGHERLDGGEQREQFGVMHVQHVRPQGAQRLRDLDGVQEAGLAAALRQRRDEHAPGVTVSLGAGREVGDLVARLAERPALALVDTGVVRGVHHREVDDADPLRHAGASPVAWPVGPFAPMRSSQRPTTLPAEPTKAPSAAACSTSRQYTSS